MSQFLGLALTTSGLIWIISFVVRGSRPRFAGKPRSARKSWGFLRRYHAIGWTARVAAGIPMGWAVGEISALAGMSVVFAFVAAALVAALTWTVAPMLEPAVGCLALVAQVAAFVALDDVPAQVVIAVLGSALIIGAGVVAVFSLGRSAPVALAAVIDIALYQVEFAGGVTPSSALVLSVLILASMLLASVAPDLILTLLGVALPFASLAALVLLFPQSTQTLFVALAAMAGVVPVAAVLRFVPRRPRFI